MAENTKQKEKLINDLETQISKIDKALTSMKKSVDDLQVGNGKFSYWNGSNACLMVKNVLMQYNTDKELLKNLSECRSKIKK